MTVQAARVVFPPEDREEIAAAITDILASGVLTLGRYTQRFESRFAAAHESPFAVATSSGTAALEILFRAMDLAGKDVIVPANTFYATAAAVIFAGARPVFADIDPVTFALSPQTLERALTPDTAAAVLVHIGGLITPHADELARMCQSLGIMLVEDAAHAHGSTYDGRYAGSFGTAAAFSFYPTKVVTSGEGGMIVTTSAQLADEAKIYRDQGKGSFGSNHHVRQGYAWRMSELHAATGLVHLNRMQQSINRRREVAGRYDAALSHRTILRPLAEPAGCRSNFYKYIAVLPTGIDRSRFRQELAARHQVRLSGEVYDLPLHKQPVLAPYAPDAKLPVAEDMCERHVCLPIHSDMRDDEIDEVLTAVASMSAIAFAPAESVLDMAGPTTDGADGALAAQPTTANRPGEPGGYPPGPAQHASHAVEGHACASP